MIKSPPTSPLLMLVSLLGVLYPVAMLLLLPHLNSLALALIGVGLMLIRGVLTHRLWLHLGLALPLVAIVLFGSSELGMRLYPVMGNALMLFIFASSLRGPMPIIERLARLKEPDLPEAGVRYTRQVTRVWCAFFTINMIIAALTALFADIELWTLYNGVISYCLTGALFAGEWLVRHRVRRRATS
ncbi:hypothetical protein [Larsenimonas salina]|uniref:COG4648 family protein n=1 Tax=Larsenimonas salina TaxID=1295565 RepID=UPI002072C748|nr:hypothetical protein [Larsenimonas salina]MCM5705006.1 hypothetical protein [Larsenimonas salina]